MINSSRSHKAAIQGRTIDLSHISTWLELFVRRLKVETQKHPTNKNWYTQLLRVPLTSLAFRASASALLGRLHWRYPCPP